MTSAKAWDAKKAKLEAQRAEWESQVDNAAHCISGINEAIAALGPRPAERVVEWVDADGHTWTWTHDGTRFFRAKNSYTALRQIDTYAAIMPDMPPAKVIEVAALALPEGPVDLSEMREVIGKAIERATDCYTDRAVRAADKIIALLGTLYRTPQPKGVEVGRIDRGGMAFFTRASKDFRDHRLIAVPIPEAK